MIRLNQMMMGVSVIVGGLILTPQIWHQYQLWRNEGVTCQQMTEDGKATFYGKDCQSANETID